MPDGCKPETRSAARGGRDERKRRLRGCLCCRLCPFCRSRSSCRSCPSRPSCPMKQLVIAIDGPSGAGKGTVARAVAAQLGYRHVDSGAMYRAVGWKAVKNGVPLDDEEAIAALARRSRIDVTTADVSIDGADVTRAIRTPDIDRAAAAVARLPKVRTVLVDGQRRLGAGGAIVMEGRDIGTA